jgi:Flp pilus assembly protein TadD
MRFTRLRVSGVLRRAVVVVVALLASGAPGGCAKFEAARLYDSGTAAIESGDSARAIADLERAATLAPDASEIQNHLGIAYQAAGRDSQAADAFERALELDCDNTAARTNLDRLRLRLAREARE